MKTSTFSRFAYGAAVGVLLHFAFIAMLTKGSKGGSDPDT